MKILPPQTRPSAKPTVRRHRPGLVSHWTAFRPCLRWDFGFTCALCLLHEADLYGGQSGEGLAGTTAEHRIARSDDPSRANDYENCLYACRLCNRSRSAWPLWYRGARLLDPTEDPWGQHFVTSGDTLLPAHGDADADYTHRTYELDDPRKTERRRARRELLSDRLRLLDRLDGEVAEILRLAGPWRRFDLKRFVEILRQLRSLRAEARRALEDVKRYPAIPADAPHTCRCRPTGNTSLPEEVDRQTIDIPASL